MALSRPICEGPELRLLVIGKTGHGKSATANTLLGSDVFEISCFPESMTIKSSYEKSSRFGKKLVVVDTPGFFDTRKDDDEICMELIRSCALLSPGFHAILLVIKAERHTTENQEAVTKYFKLFGEEASEYLFLVVTHWDQVQAQAGSLDNYFRHGNEELLRLKSRCKGGAFTISNNGITEDGNDQVEKIVKMIDGNLERLGGKCFSNGIFEEMERYFNLHDNCKAACETIGGIFQCLANYRHYNEAPKASTDDESEQPIAKERYGYGNMQIHSAGRDKWRRGIADAKVKHGFFAKLVNFFRSMFEALLRS